MKLRGELASQCGPGCSFMPDGDVFNDRRAFVDREAKLDLFILLAIPVTVRILWSVEAVSPGEVLYSDRLQACA